MGVKDTPGAVIGTDGRISLTEGQERLELMFDQLHQVSVVKLTVFETDRENSNGVITELIVPCKLGKARFPKTNILENIQTPLDQR